MFLSPEVFRAYMLPYVFKELVIVADRFHIRPLLPLLSGDGRFYILALSQNKVRLLQGTHYSVNEVPLTDVPKNLAETLRDDDSWKGLQMHSVYREGRRNLHPLRMGLRRVARRTSSDTFEGLIKDCMSYLRRKERL